MPSVAALSTALPVALVGLLIGINKTDVLPTSWLPSHAPVSISMNVSWAPITRQVLDAGRARQHGDFAAEDQATNDMPIEDMVMEDMDPGHAVTEERITEDKVKILSYDPFIAHIVDFISPEEREHLKQLAAPLLSRSTVMFANGSRLQSSVRTSSTAFLPRNEDVVTKIRQRAARFQGYLPDSSVDVQVTAYQQGQQYKAHWDWFPEPDRTNNRLSTFFAVIHADCDNCGTQFPKLRVDWSLRDPAWCEYFDCSKPVLTTRNIPGGAVFWRNLDSAGEGRDDMMHAGLPAEGGTKIGLNVWTNIDLYHFPQQDEADQIRNLSP